VPSSQLEKVDEISVLPPFSTVTPKFVYDDVSTNLSIRRIRIKVGDFLSIDGRNGSVYAGRHPAKEIKEKT
jgi:hypothetical protein